MAKRSSLYALAFNVLLVLANALPSVPVATDPVVVTTTVPTVVPSLVTIYSVVPATDANPNALMTVTTTINGQPTTITSTAVIAGSVTSTIISTISFTTSQVVLSTVGFSTIYGADPTTAATVSSVPATSISTSETPLPTTSVAPPVTSTTSTTKNTSTSTSTSGSSTLTSPTSTIASSTFPATSSASPASNVNNSSTTTSQSSLSGGLSTGAKAGIGIGVIVAVALLVVLSFLLGQRYSRRRNAKSGDMLDDAVVVEKNSFHAGRPYESTGPHGTPTVLPTNKGHTYSTHTTTLGSQSPAASERSSDALHISSIHNHHNSPQLSALPSVPDDSDQMYVGVPAHMSGSKRWSMKEFVKNRSP